MDWLEQCTDNNEITELIITLFDKLEQGRANLQRAFAEVIDLRFRIAKHEYIERANTLECSKFDLQLQLQSLERENEIRTLKDTITEL